MTIGSAPLGEGPLRSDQDAKTWLCLQRQGRQSKQEAQGSRSVTVSRRDHLVQHAAGKTGPWKMSVDLGQAERECVWLSPEERGLQFCNGASQARKTLAPGSARSLGLLVQGLLDRELAVFVVLLLGNDLARELCHAVQMHVGPWRGEACGWAQPLAEKIDLPRRRGHRIAH